MVAAHHMKITVTIPIEPSFRVSQIAGMFDVPLEKKATQHFNIEVPPLEEKDWHIGLIVGPSGSGKSTVARHLFGSDLYVEGNWPENKAVVDGFEGLPIKEITRLLTLVGFSSPPSWIKPYRVLSNGERFRCDLARALAGTPSTLDGTSTTVTSKAYENRLVVFDEFTSVVDRNIARVASAAIAKGIKSEKLNCRFVAVTCHYDITEWLEPDWVLDMAVGTVSRRCLRRPSIRLRVVRCDRRAWSLFARHHYLSGNLASGCRCYLALWNEEPVAFCAMIAQMGFKNRWRVSRIVTLPDYQGIGIGAAFLETLGDLYRENVCRFSITASHPSVIAHCNRSAKWKAVNVMKTGSKGGRHKSSLGRAVVSFEYAPE